MRWLTELHRRLQLYPETLALAVSIVDRFLASVKVEVGSPAPEPSCPGRPQHRLLALTTANLNYC